MYLIYSAFSRGKKYFVNPELLVSQPLGITNQKRCSIYFIKSMKTL